jgi:lipid-A-disaccharide synthase
LRIFISAPDASGDLHAAALVAALRKRVEAAGESLEVRGLGGAALEKAGAELVVHQSELAVAGLVEVVASAGRVLSVYTRLRRELTTSKPDLAIFVDSPDLNLPLASVARRSGLRSLYYIAPQFWAWRQGRVRKLRRRVDHTAVIFPFEEQLLRDAGVEATFVGHPLVDRMDAVRRDLDPERVARELGVDPQRPLLGLLPGSRRNELAGNLPVMLETAELLAAALPELQIRLLLAATLDPPELPAGSPVQIVPGRTHEAMAISSLLIAAPGTVTVEAALLGVPLMVTHRVNALTFELARRMTRVPSSCMVNLIAERGVVSERLQEAARPAALAAEAASLLRDPARREAMRRELLETTARLGGSGAAERAADLALRVADRA